MESHQTGVNFRSVVSDLIRAKSLELSKISQNSNDEYNILAFNLFPFLPEINDSVKGLFVPNINFTYTRHLGQCTNTKVNKCASCRKVLKNNQITYCSDRCKIEKDVRNGKSNDRNNFKKRFKKLVSKPSLFDVSGMVKLSEQQKQWINNN